MKIQTQQYMETRIEYEQKIKELGEEIFTKWRDEIKPAVIKKHINENVIIINDDHYQEDLYYAAHNYLMEKS